MKMDGTDYVFKRRAEGNEYVIVISNLAFGSTEEQRKMYIFQMLQLHVPWRTDHDVIGLKLWKCIENMSTI